MALKIHHREVEFGVGDVVRVHQKITEAGKTRNQVFEGMVIGIKGRENGKTFTVRKIGAQRVGIEMIFPLSSPTIEKIEVSRRGMEGVKQAKLYYVRGKSTREIEKIYSRAAGKNKPEVRKKKVKAKARTVKRASINKQVNKSK